MTLLLTLSRATRLAWNRISPMSFPRGEVEQRSLEFGD